MADDPIREEQLRRNLTTKEVYHFVDSEKGIDQICREVFKSSDKVVHYPIGFNGGPKYSRVKQFIYEGFGNQLPVGVSKSSSRGLGFTKVLKPLIEFIEASFPTATIRIIKKGESVFSADRKTLTLSESDLIKLHEVFQHNLDIQKQDREVLASEELHNLFPDAVDSAEREYVKNSISTALSTWKQSLDEFSNTDKEAIKELFEKLMLADGFISPESLLKTKETIDEQYIDDVIAEYEKLMQQKTETENLEKKWQGFLKKHSWIFSYIFSFPIILHEDEAYVGGKGISNKNGKVADFLVKNNLTNNVAFIEIKTHKTDLVKKGSAYRGNDVFSMSSDLSGGISQVLNQRDNFQKQFAIHKMNSEDKGFETFNSKCVVLMGSISDLSDKELGSFELFRSNSKDVEILTFDELLARFNNLKELMMGKVN
ncbi:DUF4263 domain-containing protein [Seonamhaeicola sediminis]|uniref:DUF4263 domain-containing protein n=1 Tax=Seonamhaeicola sediminis TaxID=2528206 RepID=A0A562Y8G2_9FLAO|nr:Shedu immune nuclease family protein [Seonamhaeicola sediminis]TWO30673.1 DUF4263 domain-containing protein [Seonamhaeicola sediminis]